MKFFNKNHFKLSSFTLIEIIVVLTILSILGILVTHALKPAETAKSYRDTKRAADVKNIEKALNTIISLYPNFRISNYASSNIDTIYSPIDPGNALQAVEIFGQKRLYGAGGDPSTSTPIGLIQAFDISDPLNPQSLGVINAGINAPVRTLRIANCHIYISTRPEHAIRIYQIGTKY